MFTWKLLGKYLRKPIRDNRKIFVKNPNPKKNWKSHFFWQISAEEFSKSEILLQILFKIWDPQIRFSQNSKIVFNPRIAVKYKKNILQLQIFLSRDNCARSQPASYASPASKMVESREKGVYNRKHDDLVCHNCGRDLGNHEVFCRGCGTLKRLNHMSSGVWLRGMIDFEAS